MDAVSAEVVLPWPPPSLSPNGRLHWAAVARAKKAYRLACRAPCAHLRGLFPGDEPIAVVLEFCPPARTASGRKSGVRYDQDNLVARMKAGLDGVADALGVDDSRFRLTVTEGARTGIGLVRVLVSN